MHVWLSFALGRWAGLPPGSSARRTTNELVVGETEPVPWTSDRDPHGTGRVPDVLSARADLSLARRVLGVVRGHVGELFESGVGVAR
ncbi:hypothetical protein [Streptomyces sp. NBC_01497]|uniref:hypothetical protein n=1 Tax=Streptomyces sp. NBC_01497 TaxID=2903885 RepID=UPI002E3173CA|nr:hypothetical protein [Streptomyces sp. NBC_01497]